MLFFEYPPCSTCRRAKAWLDANGVGYTARHIKDEPPSADELAEWIRISGLDVKRFFNTSGQLYRSMKLSEKLPAMSFTEAVSLLAADGMLIKRPLVIDGDTVLVGFRESEWEEKLL